MTKLLTPEETTFESAYCTRCGGSGKHSFNQVDRDVCYGCSGQGVQLTKRGRAAADYFKQLMTRKVADLKVGDVVKYRNMVGINQFVSGFAPIVEIEAPKVNGYSIVNGERKDTVMVTYWLRSERWGRLGSSVGVNSNIVVRGSNEERAEATAKALAFQATLTKAGVPSKRSN